MDVNPLYQNVRNQLSNFLFKELSVNYFYVDKEGILRDCNERVIALFQKNSHALIGKHILEFVMPEAWENCQYVMQQKKSLIIEETHIEPDGKETFFLSIKEPAYNEKNEVIGVLGIGIDITERKRSEEREKIAIESAAKEHARAESEAELRRAISIFTGSIAHDLRTPLSAMLILIDLFDKNLITLTQEREKVIDASNNKSFFASFERFIIFPEKMRKLINEMNEFITFTLSSMRHLISGTLNSTDFTVCSIESCFHAALEKYPFKEKELDQIHVLIDHDFEFLGHPVLFYRVIFNLIKNSFEQINKNKKGEIFITTELQKNKNVLRFKDTAGGAAAEIVLHLFDGYKTTKKEGAGVGLAFCKLTMQSFGGDIICESVEGDYIEFILFFPKIENDNSSLGKK